MIADRKPCIGLMGEFSAGKSTLCNLLLGAQILPQQVTATRLPPVWLSYGNAAADMLRVDGSSSAVALDRLDLIDVAQTRCIRVPTMADILTRCDLIDFPGISDPNMAADVWQRMVPQVDGVIWCSHATQAWRQSEASVWETMPAHLRATSMLVLTRADKLLTPRDTARVVARVQRETVGLFSAVMPVSLTRAMGGDSAEFNASGAAAMVNHLLEIVDALARGAPLGAQAAPQAQVAPRRVVPLAPRTAQP